MALPGRWLFAMTWRVHCRRPAAGGLSVPTDRGKRGRDTKVSLPLLTPQPFLWTRLPSVARLKTRGSQGRLVLQGHILDRSGAFRSGTPPPCTVWPRTVMRGGLRKGNSGHNSIPKPARRTEPSPRNPRLAANALLSGSKEGLGESRGGKGTIPGALFPFCPRRRAAALPRHVMANTPGPGGPNSPAAASRRNGGTVPPLLRGRKKGRLPPLGQLLLPSEEENEPDGHRDGDKKDHREPEPRG